MGEDSERGAVDGRLDEQERLAALAAVIPALAHRLNNGLLPLVGLGELVQADPAAPAVARIAATADERGRSMVRSIKALSELAKQSDEGPVEVDARAALESVELLLDPLAEAHATSLGFVAPDELPTRVDPRGLLHWLVAAGVRALAAPDPRLRIRVRRRGERWWVETLGTRRDGPDPLGRVQRTRGRLERRRLELPAFGAPVAPESTARTPRARVLVVERDPELAELLEAVLGEAGYAPRVSADAEAAERLARSEGFDLLLIGPGAGPREQLADLELAERLRPRIRAAIGVIGSDPVARRLGAPRALPREFRPGELLAYLEELASSADASARTSSGSSASS